MQHFSFRRPTAVLAAILGLLLLLVSNPPVSAEAAAGGACQQLVDLVLVIDDSGSMAAPAQGSPLGPDVNNDPQNLRITAAHLLVDLMDDQDRVGVVLFSDGTKKVRAEPLSKGRAAVHDKIDEAGSKGTTNLVAALRDALEEFEGSASGVARGILLLTDGRLEDRKELVDGKIQDVPAADQLTELLQLADHARKQGIRIYAMGLGAGADTNLLSEVAKRSSSPQIWQVKQASDLTEAYLQILQELKGVYVDGAGGANSLRTLGLSDEVTIAVVGPDQESLTITMPDGVRPDPDKIGNRYALYRLPNKDGTPQEIAVRPGVAAWRIERPPVSILFELPGTREDMTIQADLPVRVVLQACGLRMPDGLTVQAVLLQDREPTPHQAMLEPVTTGGYAFFGFVPLPTATGEMTVEAIVRRASDQVATREQPFNLIDRAVSFQPAQVQPLRWSFLDACRDTVMPVELRGAALSRLQRMPVYASATPVTFEQEPWRYEGAYAVARGTARLTDDVRPSCYNPLHWYTSPSYSFTLEPLPAPGVIAAGALATTAEVASAPIWWWAVLIGTPLLLFGMPIYIRMRTGLRLHLKAEVNDGRPKRLDPGLWHLLFGGRRRYEALLYGPEAQGDVYFESLPTRTRLRVTALGKGEFRLTNENDKVPLRVDRYLCESYTFTKNDDPKPNMTIGDAILDFRFGE